MVTIADDTL